jgi:hypothetical protein
MIASALLEGVPTVTRWVLVAVVICLFVGETYLFGRLGRRIKATGGPGYNAFQGLDSAAAVREARRQWGATGLATARKAWLLDLFYPPTYALLGVLFASLGATDARAQGSHGLADVLEVVAWLSIAAGATDLLVENSGVAVGLWSSPSDTAARVARIAGWVKVFLLGVVAAALLVALVVLLVT